MAQQHAVDAGGQHLRELPRIGADRRLVRPGDRHVHDDGGRAMAAFRRAALRQPAHIIRQALHVEGSVLHVVADVVRQCLGVLLTLFERSRRPRMGAGVIDGLALFEKLDGPVDALRFRGLRQRGARQVARRTMPPSSAAFVIFGIQVPPSCEVGLQSSPKSAGMPPIARSAPADDMVWCDEHSNIARQIFVGLLFAAALHGEVKALRNFTLIDGTGKAARAVQRHDCRERPRDLGRARRTVETPRRGRGGRLTGQVRHARNHQPARASRQHRRSRTRMRNSTRARACRRTSPPMPPTASRRCSVSARIRMRSSKSATSSAPAGRPLRACSPRDRVFSFTGRLRRPRWRHAGVATAAEADAAVEAQTKKRVDIVKLWMDDHLGAQKKMPYDIAKAIIDGAHKRSLRGRRPHLLPGRRQAPCRVTAWTGWRTASEIRMWTRR